MGDTLAEVPFGTWGEHFMIVRGSLTDRPEVNLFVDTGLVAGTRTDGQVAVLASRDLLAHLGARPTATRPIVRLPGPISIAAACLHEATAVEVTPATWRDFGDWGGIDVEALVSWGFFKHVAPTIDFDRSRYLIDPPAHA